MVRYVWMAAAGLGLVFGAVPVACADPGSDTGTAVAASAPTALAAGSAPNAAPSTQTPSTQTTSTPPDGVSHLPSPGSLPPGAVQGSPEPRTFGYLRDLFQAVRSDDVSMKEALLLLAQRPLDTPAAVMTPREAPPVPAATQDEPAAVAP